MSAIIKIVMDIKGHRIEMTLNEIEELQRELNRIFYKQPSIYPSVFRDGGAIYAKKDSGNADWLKVQYETHS